MSELKLHRSRVDWLRLIRGVTRGRGISCSIDRGDDIMTAEDDKPPESIRSSLSNVSGSFVLFFRMILISRNESLSSFAMTTYITMLHAISFFPLFDHGTYTIRTADVIPRRR